AFGYDLVYNYEGFTRKDRRNLKEKLFYPLAKITQQFPESASNRQLWYNNVSAAVGFLFDDQALIDFALKGEYGFEWQLGSALPESGFWAEGPGYHFVALRGMIHLAEMARHNRLDLYHLEIAGRSMKKMFDAPFEWIKPNYEFPRSKDSGGGNILEYATFYEVGFAVYKDPKYLALLNLTHLKRGTQLVGIDSGLGARQEPLTLFNLVPELPQADEDIYTEKSVDVKGNGFDILRNGTGTDRRYLYLDYGIMGGEHGHPDRLQMGYYALGRNWIVDPLNESYFNPNLQTWYRQSIAHNTIVLDQTTQTWTNGYSIFFGSLPAFQVASGGSETMYPGAKLTRTLIQIDNYFVDLCDVECGEQRIIDYPIHSFDKLTIEGVEFKKQPIDRFGHRPGIPGYDQLTEIYSGKTDEDWNACFATAEGDSLLVQAIGEDGTEVFKAITPPIGGFYKQMVKNQRPLPMFFSRRMTDKTRFAHLFHAFRDNLAVVHFEKSDAPNHYLVFRTNGIDEIHADLENSVYYVLRKEQDQPTLLAGFGLTEVVLNEIYIFSSIIQLNQFECHWEKNELSITTVSDFGQVKIFAPKIENVELNGKKISFQRNGDYVILTQNPGIALNLIAPKDSVIFQGIQNKLIVQVSNYTDHPIADQIKLSLAKNWQEQVQSQLNWWGGIVNLKATNKKLPLKKLFPKVYRKDAPWIDELSSKSKTIQIGKSEIYEISLLVPNDAPPVNLPIQIEFGNHSIRQSMSVKPPISADLLLLNAAKEIMLIKLSNHTYQHLKVSSQLVLDSAWKIKGDLNNEIDLPGQKTETIEIPIQFIGYRPEEQLYPIQLKVKSENFQTEIVRDFYVGVAHFAATPPSLEGD
ncbi:MAG TPA: heparinase II/III family protein, partial [bacterium]